MKQYGTLAAVFGGTLAVLLVAFLVIEQLGTGGAVAVASPSPSTPALTTFVVPTQGPTPIPSARPSVGPSVAPSGSGPVVTAAPSPVQPTPTPRPSKSVPPTGKPGDIVRVVVPGSQFVKSVVQPNSSVAKVGGAAVMVSDRTFSNPTTLTYTMPSGSVPSGTRIVRLDVAVCGDGSGDFWETYGPSDMEPIEYEVVPPEADGCWHYVGGSGKDSTVLAIIHLESRFQIDEVVYTITTG